MNAIKTALDFMPALSIIGAILWVTFVHRSHLKKLRRAYESASVPFPSSLTISAWSPFRITADDPPALRADKARIITDIRKKNWLVIPLFFGSFFGLAILSIILQSALHL